jgi:Metallo-peptidase family M12/Secretion system C-terminal sorting domain
LLVTFIGTAIGQFTATGSPKSLTTSQSTLLSQKFSAYQTYKLNFPMLNTFVKSQQNGMANITLQLGENHNWALQIKRHEIRSGNYLLGIQTQNGITLHQKGECNTYKGFLINDPTQQARLLISQNSIRGSILENGIMYMIEPLTTYLGTEATANQDIIVYKRKDAFIAPLVCLTNDGWGGGGNPPVDDRDHCEHPDCSEYGFPNVERHMELAIETDCEFFENFKQMFPQTPDGLSMAIDEANAHILDLVNQLDHYYTEAVNLHVYLVYINLWTDCNANNSNDPYIGNDMLSHWDQLRNYWNSNMTWVQRDLVHFFSGKDLSATAVNGTFGGSSGFAAAFCGSPLSDFPPQYTDYRHESYTVSDGPSGFHTLAHEVGHYLGLGHSCDCGLMHASSRCEFLNLPIPNCTPSDCMSHTTSLSSHATICSALNAYNHAWGYPSDACLQSPPPTSPDFDIVITRTNGSPIQDGGVICAGEVFSASFTNTFNNYGATWSLGPGLAFVTPPTGTVFQVTTTSNGPLTSFIRGSFSYNGANFIFERILHIGLPLPVGTPIISSTYVYPTGTLFSVGFPMPPGANFIEYSYTVTIPNQPSNFYNGTTTNANPLVTGLPQNACVSFHLYPGNECGTNYNPPYPSIDICFGTPNPIIAAPGSNIASTETLKNKLTDPKDFGFAEKIRVFPNPANASFFISLSRPAPSLNIRVYAVNGRLVYQANLTDVAEAIEINAATWPSGVYLLHAIQADFGQQVKLVVEH